MSFAEKVRKGVGPKSKAAMAPLKPLWAGPCGDTANGGVTQGLIGKFLNCRERFRVTYIEGLKPTAKWSHRLGYGNMWHVCEEALADGSDPLAEGHLLKHAKRECMEFPLQAAEIDHWYNVCRIQWPLYVKHWAEHHDVIARKPVVQEYQFNVPYVLPGSGRKVYLRGKWDSVDVVSRQYSDKGKPVKVTDVWLQENKTKGDIDELGLKRQLSFDLQSGVYLVALQYAIATNALDCGKMGIPPIGGVRYNVVRRPLSGGAGSIRQHKPTKSNPQGESKAEFYDRLRGIIEEVPETYFMRWNVDVLPSDIEEFKRQTLNPVLEQLCDWWELINFCTKTGANPFESKAGLHWRHPYGCTNMLDEGYMGDVDEYLLTGNAAGLRKVETVFPELA